MSSLESPQERSEHEDSQDEVTVQIAEKTSSVDIPDVASTDEAVAIATAVGAHVTDQQRAAVVTDSARDTVEYTNAWRFVGQMHSQGKRRIPRNVEKGDEWKAAGRAFPR